MIAFAQAHPSGNAISILLQPPVSAQNWRVLRKEANTFVDENDPAAYVVPVEPEQFTFDIFGLVNGQTYWYKPFYFIGGSWVANDPVSITATATFADASPDPFSLIRDRLYAGLKIYVDRGDLSHKLGAIPVMTSSPLIEETVFPVVSVHMRMDAQEIHGIGERIDPDEYDGTDVISSEGWLSKMSLDIIGWCLNSDERKELRKAIRTILIANLPIFENKGVQEIAFQMSDTDDFKTYGMPMFMANFSLSCLYPATAEGRFPDVAVVNSNLEVVNG